MAQLPRLTPTAADRLARLRRAGHSVAYGRATDGRTTFFWARVTPHGSVVVRTVTAGDVQTLVEKAAHVTETDPGAQLVASFTDPLRSCRLCGAELSFDEGSGEDVFTCPRGAGHDVVRSV